uniref:uncharacterized protein LOC129507950 n=1 Tax=Nyctereutes procyonoides TaxID=34880 RepID=UPI002444E86C|nr:uncharacterized protein LOC129507950 [Nyctereutes procyonoides]
MGGGEEEGGAPGLAGPLSFSWPALHRDPDGREALAPALLPTKGAPTDRETEAERGVKLALATRQWGQEGTWAAWRRRLPRPAKWVLGASCAGRTDRQMRAFTGVPSQPSPSFQGVCQDLMHPGRPMLGRRTGGARLSQASLGMARPRGGCKGPRCPTEKPRLGTRRPRSESGGQSGPHVDSSGEQQGRSKLFRFGLLAFLLGLLAGVCSLPVSCPGAADLGPGC